MTLETAARPTDEFNLSATPSEEMKRKLLYYALTGNESIATPYTMAEGGLTRAESQRRKDRDFEDFVRFAMASRERVERFQAELTKLEEKRVALLARTEAELRESQERLQQLRAAATEIDFPDGTRRKIFRDGAIVRDEGGAVVSPDIIKAEGVSNNPEQWSDFSKAKDYTDKLAERRDRLNQIGERLKEAGQQADDGKISDKDMDEFKADLEKALVAEERPIAARPAAAPVPRERTFGTAVTPTTDFTLAAPGNMPGTQPREPDKKVKPPSPDVSAPAPM